jgi:hypothetical protein
LNTDELLLGDGAVSDKLGFVVAASVVGSNLLADDGNLAKLDDVVGRAIVGIARDWQDLPRRRRWFGVERGAEKQQRDQDLYGWVHEDIKYGIAINASTFAFDALSFYVALVAVPGLIEISYAGHKRVDDAANGEKCGLMSIRRHGRFSRLESALILSARFPEIIS